MQLPTQYIDNMKRLLGDDIDAYLSSLDDKRLYGLRVNTAKISCEEFEKCSPFPIERIPYIPNGYYYDGDAYTPAKHPYYFAGLYYLQDPSAMTPASRLPISEGDRVLDLCAAPGGKSTELAARLRGTGVIIANDISAKRAKALQKNIELFGVANSVITCEYPERLKSYFEGYFDKILIDAPCSGEGMFRKDPAMVKAWTDSSPTEYALMQEDIVKHALPMLADGGYMLYSTCTFSPLEDEGTASKILSLDDSLELVDIEPYDGFSSGRPDMIGSDDISIEKCVRIFPHRMDGEGHFLALFHKKNNSNIDDINTDKISEDKSDIYIDNNVNRRGHANRVNKPVKSGKPSKESKKLWEEFSKILNINIDINLIEEHEGKLFLDTLTLPDVSGLHFLRRGLYLGECKKNRFEPSQAFAMTLSLSDVANVLDLSVDDDRVYRYLRGETISTGDNTLDSGYVLVCVDGYSLGWGKCSGSAIKNKYHVGWRLMS